MQKNKIIELKNIIKKFGNSDSEVTIIDRINIDVNEGEIIGILGKSGCGKSTVLRIMSNLIEPCSGEILYKSHPIKDTDPKISMVFQTFALIPWLNIFENIALGLQAQNLPIDKLKEKVQKALNLVGLNGYEEAYPKEMSGGMRQRVGIARALVVDPEVLLMDEAFSALDYLTSDNLKSDLLDLWFKKSVSSMKAIVLVSHSIEEVVNLCDRVIILSSHPGRVIENIKIDIPHPRDKNSQKFHELLDKLYLVLGNAQSSKEAMEVNEIDLHKNYPKQLSVINLFHFLLTIKSKLANNKVSLQVIAEELQINNERLFMYIESLLLLKFIETQGNDITLSSAGFILLEADEKGQKIIFKEHLVKYVPFINEVYKKLQTSETISKDELLEILGKIFGVEESLSIVEATISWARYADLFTYDDIREELKLENR